MFLEYAPISRRYDVPYERQQGPNDRDGLPALDANLEVFPRDTAQVLEYWLDVTTGEASNFVAAAVDRGINYFDVAPFYGNAQERLGPALKPYRQNCFLACKTLERDAAGSKKELDESLQLLQTDHFDLYQLHALTDVEEVKEAFGPGGAMETFLKAQKDGRIRYIGFSAHSEEAAHVALDHFDFDSVLFPLSFTAWIKGKFGPTVYERAKESDMGILALKAMAHGNWPKGMKESERPWEKAWYEPFDEIDKADLERLLHHE